MSVTIRPVAKADKAAWEQLYEGYGKFYKVNQTSEMRETVWGWIMDPTEQVHGMVAENQGGAVIGLAHFRPFRRPLSATTGCFLDDLFVDPKARGVGVADALIAAVKAEAAKRGWSVVRWITAEDNYRARGVYDRVAERTKWLTYDIKL